MIRPEPLKKIPIGTRQWWLTFGANIVGTIACTAAAMVQPYSLFSVIDGFCGGVCATLALSLWMRRRSDRIFNMMVDDFNGMSALTNDVLTEWQARRWAEMRGDSIQPPEHRTLN